MTDSRKTYSFGIDMNAEPHRQFEKPILLCDWVSRLSETMAGFDAERRASNRRIVDALVKPDPDKPLPDWIDRIDRLRFLPMEWLPNGTAIAALDGRQFPGDIPRDRSDKNAGVSVVLFVSPILHEELRNAAGPPAHPFGGMLFSP